METRRDLLKFFGSGALIVPAVGSAPIAKLIEVPRVELIDEPRVVLPINLAKVRRVTVSFEMDDGDPHTWQSTGITGRGIVDPTSLIDITFLSSNGWSPSSHVKVGSLQAAAGARLGGRCPYCRSIVSGTRCGSCGASA